MTSFPPRYFTRLDGSPDERFHDVPGLVTHVDEGAIAAVTQRYHEPRRVRP